MKRVVLALGSNLGSDLVSHREGELGNQTSRQFIGRADHLAEALKKLQQIAGFQLLRRSAVYENPALLPSSADSSWDRPYLNLAVEGCWQGEPMALLKETQEIEKAMGRRRQAPWEPRPIDIDLLLVSDSPASNDVRLQLPHPGITDRNFFLAPLAELFPTEDLENFGDSFNAERMNLSIPSMSEDSSFLTRSRQIDPGLCQWMHILNLTPDSFSDGGENPSPEQWTAQLERLTQHSVSWIDVGAESTAPGRQPMSSEEEWQRLSPFLDWYHGYRQDRSLAPRLSIDTQKSEVARKAIALGAEMINDVSGLADPEMPQVLAESDVQYVLMHSLGAPVDPKRTLTTDRDIIEQLLSWLQPKVETLERSGISLNRIYFDPGIGFGKTAAQSLEILRRVDELLRLPLRLLIGASRKSFLSRFTEDPPAQRDAESLAISLQMAPLGVNILRVHQADQHAKAYQSWLHLQTRRQTQLPPQQRVQTPTPIEQRPPLQ